MMSELEIFPVLFDRTNPLFSNFPSLSNLTADEVNEAINKGNLRDKTGGSGAIWVTGLVSYFDPECMNEPKLYATVRYPYETQDCFVIVLYSTRLFKV